jgi:polysaccharide biosynthesis protein PslG
MHSVRMPYVGRLRAVAAATALAAALLAATASSAMALPRTFWGVVPQETPSTEQFQRLGKGKVGSIRVPIPWNAVQTIEGGEPNWQGPDVMIKGAALAGIDVLPFIFSAPPWAVAVDRTVASHPPMTLPVKTDAQRAAWSSFLTQAVERYGPGGDFWAENPTVPPRPVRSWQIWNEANFLYFVGRPNPADYGKLVKISDAAISAIDPGAKIVLGGLFGWPAEARLKAKPAKAYFAADFLERMYRATPGIKNRFDAVSLHPYTSRYQSLTPQIEEVRRALKESRDPGVPLWITELGWSSKPKAANNSFAKGRAGQASQLKGAFTLLRNKRTKWHVQRVYWFSITDQEGVCNFCNGSGLFEGPSFTPKPAWRAYVRFTGGKAG